MTPVDIDDDNLQVASPFAPPYSSITVTVMRTTRRDVKGSVSLQGAAPVREIHATRSPTLPSRARFFEQVVLVVRAPSRSPCSLLFAFHYDISNINMIHKTRGARRHFRVDHIGEVCNCAGDMPGGGHRTSVTCNLAAQASNCMTQESETHLDRRARALHSRRRARSERTMGSTKGEVEACARCLTE
jgi:hypothetical protein